MVKIHSSQRTAQKAESGNVLFMVLIAIVLFGLLSVVASRVTDTQESNLSQDRAFLLANEIVSYTNSMRSTIDRMALSGTDITELNFMFPSDANFNTAPNYHKVYHPNGGGMSYRALPPEAISEVINPPAARWYVQTNVNVEWTPTTANDVILSAYQIDETVCQELNRAMHGSPTIPALVNPILMRQVFVPGQGDNDLTVARCPACDGQIGMCVTDNAGAAYTFFTILSTQ